MPGPGPRGGMGRPMQKPQNVGKTIKRIVKYLSEYKGLLIAVIFCILFSSGAMIVGTGLLRPIFNDYIVPFIGQENPNLTKFVSLLCVMIVVYVIGAFASYVNSRIMLHISTRTLYRIRTELFSHLEKLPLRYFDTHTHGELMSRFTNDTDTLRDMLSQAVPQLLSSGLTVISSFVMMIVLSPVLTLVVIFCIILLGVISGFVSQTF